MPLALPFKPGAEMVAASPTSKIKPAGFCTLKSQRGCPVTASIAYSVLSGSDVPNRATPCVPVASGEKAVVTHVPAWLVRKVWTEKICEQSLALSATSSPLFTLPSLVPVYTVSTPPGGVAIIGLASMLAISLLEQSVFPVAPLKAVTVAPYVLATHTDPLGPTAGVARNGSPNPKFTPQSCCPFDSSNANTSPFSSPTYITVLFNTVLNATTGDPRSAA